MGEISYGEGEQFCYRYLGDTSPFCWHYFVSAQGYREESVDGQIVDFFDIEPGNTFEQFWGRNWRSRFL